MSNVFKKLTDEGKGKTLASGLVPVALEYIPGKPSTVSFQNGLKTTSSCLRCHDTPCMTYSDEEVKASNMPDFPADRSLDVCAAGALSRPNGVGVPNVSNNDCVGCGVCVLRCSVGAIHLEPHAVILDQTNNAFLETEVNHEADMRKVRAVFDKLSPTGYLLDETDEIVDRVKVRLDQATRRIGDKFPNHFVRNLFISVGVGAAMRRRGDNAVRMDLILSPPGIAFGVAEVEFGGDAVLDSPRDILDDVAVLVSRRGWVVSDITPLIVSDVLPNKRSEYWEIIHDIYKVLNLKIGTVTVQALILLIWNRKLLNLTPDNIFYVNKNTGPYRASVLEKMLGRSLSLSTELRSHIEVAK